MSSVNDGSVTSSDSLQYCAEEYKNAYKALADTTYRHRLEQLGRMYTRFIKILGDPDFVENTLVRSLSDKYQTRLIEVNGALKTYEQAGQGLIPISRITRMTVRHLYQQCVIQLSHWEIEATDHGLEMSAICVDNGSEVCVEENETEKEFSMRVESRSPGGLGECENPPESELNTGENRGDPPPTTTPSQIPRPPRRNPGLAVTLPQTNEIPRTPLVVTTTALLQCPTPINPKGKTAICSSLQLGGYEQFVNSNPVLNSTNVGTSDHPCHPTESSLSCDPFFDHLLSQNMSIPTAYNQGLTPARTHIHGPQLNLTRITETTETSDIQVADPQPATLFNATTMDSLQIPNEIPPLEDGPSFVDQWKQKLASMSLDQRLGYDGITRLVDRYSRINLLSKSPQISCTQKISYEREMRDLATTIKTLTKIQGVNSLLSGSIGPTPSAGVQHTNPLATALETNLGQSARPVTNINDPCFDPPYTQRPLVSFCPQPHRVEGQTRPMQNDSIANYGIPPGCQCGMVPSCPPGSGCNYVPPVRAQTQFNSNPVRSNPVGNSSQVPHNPQIPRAEPQSHQLPNVASPPSSRHTSSEGRLDRDPLVTNNLLLLGEGLKQLMLGPTNLSFLPKLTNDDLSFPHRFLAQFRACMKERKFHAGKQIEAFLSAVKVTTSERWLNERYGCSSAEALEKLFLQCFWDRRSQLEVVGNWNRVNFSDYSSKKVLMELGKWEETLAALTDVYYDLKMISVACYNKVPKQLRVSLSMDKFATMESLKKAIKDMNDLELSLASLQGNPDCIGEKQLNSDAKVSKGNARYSQNRDRPYRQANFLTNLSSQPTTTPPVESSITPPVSALTVRQTQNSNTPLSTSASPRVNGPPAASQSNVRRNFNQNNNRNYNNRNQRYAPAYAPRYNVPAQGANSTPSGNNYSRGNYNRAPRPPNTEIPRENPNVNLNNISNSNPSSQDARLNVPALPPVANQPIVLNQPQNSGMQLLQRPQPQRIDTERAVNRALQNNSQNNQLVPVTSASNSNQSSVFGSATMRGFQRL